MNAQKKLLGVITARAGSKGLPGKNIKSLNGKPLIAHTIEAALRSEVFDRLIVSTDSEEIAGIAKEYGAEVPFLRPTHLATDKAKSIDVVIHLLEWIKEQDAYYKYLMLLQPTSPLRNESDIRNAIEIIEKGDYDSVISVVEAPHNPQTYFALNDELIDFEQLRALAHVNRQELVQHYKINGAIYCIQTDFLIKEKNWFSPNTYGYIMPKVRSIDIDDEIDFYTCESILSKQKV